MLTDEKRLQIHIERVHSKLDEKDYTIKCDGCEKMIKSSMNRFIKVKMLPVKFVRRISKDHLRVILKNMDVTYVPKNLKQVKFCLLTSTWAEESEL